MSKFDYCSFSGGYDDFAVSKEKHTKEEAIELYKQEACYYSKLPLIACIDAFVKHRAGMNEDNEPCVGWWLEYHDNKRNCPVWAFHRAKTRDEQFKRYEYFELTATN